MLGQNFNYFNHNDLEISGHRETKSSHMAVLSPLSSVTSNTQTHPAVTHIAFAPLLEGGICQLSGSEPRAHFAILAVGGG